MAVTEEYGPLALYIDGEWLSASGRDGEEVLNPADGRPLAVLPHASSEDLDGALEAATRGFKVWRAMSAHERSSIIRAAANLMRARGDAIARVLTLEQGKILSESRAEIALSADILDWYAEEGMRAYGRVVPSRTPGIRYMVLQEPVGPVAAFTPWNVPAVTPARKIGGALGAGCSLIIKASEETPGTCQQIVRAFHDAGLPKGVLNLVFGVPSKVSEHLINAPAIRKISFTGSTSVGKQLAKLAADGAKRITMELGGHAPVIVFDDCDLDRAVELCASAKFRNAGQVCVSPTRFYVQEAVYKDFTERFAERTRSISVANGLLATSQMGPLANVRRQEAIRKLVDDSRAGGASILAGGKSLGDGGYFYAPTVVSDLSDDARLMVEEPFGPVAGFARFRDFEEVVDRANSLPYGLAAYAFTTSLKRANAISDALEAGMVGVNTFAISAPETPFGGVKESGYGAEGGTEGLDAYMVKKLVAHA